MILNNIVNAYIGSKNIKKLALGEKIIWQKDAFLKVVPDKIWLMKSNDYQADVEILSNVKWNVK